MIRTVLDDEKKRVEEEGGMRRMEGRGGRRDGEEGGTSRVKK